MYFSGFTLNQLINQAKISQEDLREIQLCRKEEMQLGFAYQLAFVKLLNRFPEQQPFEVIQDILNYTSIQLGINAGLISLYPQRRQTVSEHRERIRNYLELQGFDLHIQADLKDFILELAYQMEQSSSIIAKTDQFLRERKILRPSDDTLRRVIATQREVAKKEISNRIIDSLDKELLTKLDGLLISNKNNHSILNFLKQPPGRPSPSSMLKLVEKIEIIRDLGIFQIDFKWLNNNLQRFLSRYTRNCDAHKMRELEPGRRYTALISFLFQTYQDTTDFMVDMYDKLINRVYNRAEQDIDDYSRSQRLQLKHSMSAFKTIAELILDENIDDILLRKELLKRMNKTTLKGWVEKIDIWLTGKYSHVVNLVKERFSYIRQFFPAFIRYLEIEFEGEQRSDLLEAIDYLKQMNEQGKRKLPEDAPTGFIPRKILSAFGNNINNLDKPSWECALLTSLRDEIKAGNIAVKNSKRFTRFEDFFIPDKKWAEMREQFFLRANLPFTSTEVKLYIENLLDTAYDRFLENFSSNKYAKVTGNHWDLSSDPAEKLSEKKEEKRVLLEKWLEKNMRVIKLPDLLVEVDNDLEITKFFIPPSKQDRFDPQDICAVVATIMAHGCNIGPQTMSQLIEGVSYHQIKRITDWMLTEEAQRSALATVVNSISRLDITQAWGTGRTSSSDGQRFAMKRKVLQQTYSPRFNEFALEFYTFIADNYAPFFGFPIECTDRDAPFVLDGLLYNESDLPLEDHFIDSHGYTENNFAAFSMLGRSFCPRIKGLHKQRIYRSQNEKDYGPLMPIIGRQDRIIHTNWIVDQWDRMGQFYASLELGHVTASTAMRKLNALSRKNHFYRANREFGRVHKTVHILHYISDRDFRRKTTRGLLKGEQLNALARDLRYGKRGRVDKSDIQGQRNSCSCLTLILASIVYWQAKEMNRVVIECEPEKNKIDLSLLEHISPITWDNVILYGEYVINRGLIRKNVNKFI